KGNYIGTTADGLHALGNRFYGVRIDGGANNTVGGLTASPGTGPGNVISGNGAGVGTPVGVSIIGATGTGNLVEGNILGLGADGSTTISGQSIGAGTASGATGNTIGGTTAAARNI